MKIAVNKLFFAVALSFATLLTSDTGILAQAGTFEPPPPPPDPPPGGRVRGGAKRGLCPAITSKLTALVPFSQEKGSVTNVWGLTTVAHPTFWFYLPITKNSTLSTQFVLQDSQSNPVYQQDITLPNQPGVIGVTLPPTASPLALNKRYRWFFTIDCDRQKQSPPIYLEGVIQRVELKPTITQQLQTAEPLQQFTIYAQNGIWHDALTTLAQLRQKNPQNAELEAKWQDLLTSIHLDDVAKQPIVLQDK